jgi:hypothetical protein
VSLIAEETQPLLCRLIEVSKTDDIGLPVIVPPSSGFSLDLVGHLDRAASHAMHRRQELAADASPPGDLRTAICRRASDDLDSPRQRLR